MFEVATSLVWLPLSQLDQILVNGHKLDEVHNLLNMFCGNKLWPSQTQPPFDEDAADVHAQAITSAKVYLVKPYSQVQHDYDTGSHEYAVSAFSAKGPCDDNEMTRRL